MARPDEPVTRTTWHCHIAVSLDGKIARRDGTIFGLFVHPAYEGRGIARALLPLACEDLRAAGFSEATLTTGHGTRAERFYRENGWQETGRQVDGQGEDEIVFRKRL